MQLPKKKEVDSMSFLEKVSTPFLEKLIEKLITRILDEKEVVITINFKDKTQTVRREKQ